MRHRSRLRRRRSGRHWHDPERLERQEERDAQLGRTEFYVYVLDTAYGHYVGHTWNVRSRVRQHVAGQVPSTAGGAPLLIWQSASFSTRGEAARFEAALKSLRDQQSPRYREIVGLEAVPWYSTTALVRDGQRSSSSGFFVRLGVFVAVLVLVVLLYALT